MPQELTLTIIDDLNSRRGRIEGMEMVGNIQKIRAAVPLFTMLGYAKDLRGLAQGRATATVWFSF